MEIHRSYLKDFAMPKVKSKFVIDYFDGIRSALASRSDFPYPDFLACPRVRTSKEVIWHASCFSAKPRQMKDLPKDLRQSYINALQDRILAIDKLIETLNDEEDGESLKNLLIKAVAYIDEQSVYCGDGNVVIVNWGLIPRMSHNDEDALIYKRGHYSKYYVQEQKVSSPVNVVPDPELPVFENDIINDIIEEPQKLEHEKVIHDEEKDIEDVTPLPPEIPDPVIDFPHPPKPHERTEDVIEEQSSDDSEKETGRNNDNGDEDLSGEEDSPAPKPWFWMVLGTAMLALATVLFFARGLIMDPLPKVPMVLPFTEADICWNSDSVQVVNGRLNILLEPTGETAVRDWAKAFKRVYWRPGYKVIFYDEDLYMLQIRVPEHKREQVKNEIKLKLNDFHFDVYDENVMSSDDRIFNDPGILDANASWYLSAVGAFEAWTMNQGTKDVIVGVVDSGFDLDHPELKKKAVDTYNVITGKKKVWPVKKGNEVCSHGTHVASTAIGNGNNGHGLLGIAPDCQLLAVQVGSDETGSRTTDLALQQGVKYAVTHGADVVNISYGSTLSQTRTMNDEEQLRFITNYDLPTERIWNRIYEIARQKNSIIVWSAGNENVISGVDPKKRNPRVIKVSAVGPYITKAGFSNYGRFPEKDKIYSDLSAPGISIYNAVPNNSYAYKSGTSMAAPVVTGAVALLKSIDRSITEEDAVNILSATGRNIDPAIGPMINIGAAVRMMMSPGYQDRLKEIRKEMERLRRQLDSLDKLASPHKSRADTLKFGDVLKDPLKINGLWKCTIELYNSSDQSPVELYMRFADMTGELIIKSHGEDHKAPLKLEVKGKTIQVEQLEEARNETGTRGYKICQYICTADSSGNLECKMTNPDQTLTFNLVRVK